MSWDVLYLGRFEARTFSLGTFGYGSMLEGRVCEGVEDTSDNSIYSDIYIS